MIAAQYEILLPADYDMGIIRRRVCERGAVLDGRAGLGLKAYLIQDVAEQSPINAYAPFYLWRDPAALAAFHWGGQGFSGIVHDFGRPAVRTWIGGGFSRGEAFAATTPAYASRRLRPLASSIDPVDAASMLDQDGQAVRGGPGVHSHAWGIDPNTWQSVELTLFARHPGKVQAPDTTVYRVLHLSTPEIDDIR
jgi:hypothetical protein